jgi:thermostable 8-oxoguanine DNA glycosylase
MIDPRCITNFQRSDYELQEFLLFCVCVAGKSSEQQAVKLEKFLYGGKALKPFPNIENLIRKDMLIPTLQEVKKGQYTRISKAFTAIVKANLDLRTCSIADLEKIRGIGPKTARFFMLHSREGQEVAVLDTHILSWMRSRGWKAPKATPSQPLYGKLEVAFLMECVWGGQSPATLDLAIWKDRQVQSAAAKALKVQVAA